MKERLEAVVGARINEFKRKMAQVKRIMKTTPTKAVAVIDANKKRFDEKIEKVKKSLLYLKAQKVVITIRDNFKRTQDRLDRISKTIHTLGNVGANMLMGGFLAFSPALVPLLGGLIASLAMLGPMLGVIAGSTFALASAFALAGAGAVAFGALAIPTISKVFEEGAKLNKQQKEAKKAFEKMKKTYQGIVKEMEKPVLEAFRKSMEAVNQMLDMARPTFKAAADAVNNLMDSLKASLGTPPVKAFFDYMNREAGPLLEITGKAIGNVFKGLMSMMVAFEPLTRSIAQGFLDMTKRFAEWADGLSRSKKFQSFMKYVQDNMPKVRAIFRDATAGMVYFFSAFGPLAADMMTGLADLMKRFKEWSKTLDQNQSFQNFIQYIRDNGPAMLTFIGQIADLIVNLARALAPIGQQVLGIANQFLAWFNNLLVTNPEVGKLIGYGIVLAGVFQALYPVITVLTSMFNVKLFMAIFNLSKALGTKLMPVFTRIWTWLMQTFIPMLSRVAGWFVRLGTQAIIQGGRMAAGWLIAMGPIGWAILAIAGLAAVVIMYWDEIKAWTIKTWQKVSDWIKEKWVEATIATGKFVSELVSKAVTYFTQLGSKVKEKMNQAKQNIQQKWEEAKSTTASKLSNLVSTVQTWFTNVVNKVKTKMSDAVKAVGEKVAEMPGKVREKAGEMLSAGADLIRGLIDGIKNMGQEAINAVAGVVDGVVAKAKSLLKINSPSRVFRQIGEFTGEGMIVGMNNMLNGVTRAATNMTNAAMIQPQTFAFDASVNTSGFGAVRDELNANFNQEQQHTTENYEGMFKGANFYVREEQDIQKIARELEQLRKQRGGRV